MGFTSSSERTSKCPSALLLWERSVLKVNRKNSVSTDDGFFVYCGNSGADMLSVEGTETDQIATKILY